MTEVTIWHNPRCTKSRQTLALIEEKGITPTIRKYLEDAPSEAEIRATLDRLGVAPIDMMRTGETVFREAGLGRDSDDATLIAAMESSPILIERPILIAGGRAVIARPPEKGLDLL